MHLQNLHTHTRFCDGQNRMEQMIKGAIRLGMTSVGFSGHSPLPFPNNWAMTPSGAEKYCASVQKLKKRYEGKLQVYLGMEQDYHSAPAPEACEYLIGSVHQIPVGDRYYPVDYTAQTLIDAANMGFGGDIYGVVEAYYSLVGAVAEKTGCQIVGHFDVITKNQEKMPVFDTDHPRYAKAAMNALDALSGKGLIFEVNTGAMSRGFRTAPYPDRKLLQAMREQNIPICITSDAHNWEHLCYGFREASEWVRSCGYRSCMYWNGIGFYEDSLPG